MTTSTSNSKIDISVIVPMYNSAKFIEHMIGSIFNQENHNLIIELIIVDDMSADNSRELVKRIGNEKIKLLELKKNGGTACARNAGLQSARGEWIQFVDSDDAICNDLYRKFELVKNPDYNCYLFSLISEFPDHTLQQTIREVKDKRAFGHFGGIWNKFIKREICLPFKENFSFEDNCFIIDMMIAHELKITLISDAFYIYNRKNEYSKMANFNFPEWRKMHTYLYDQISRADRYTRMYILEIAFATLFDRSIPLKESLPVALNVLRRLIHYLPATALSQNRHFLKNIRHANPL